jgi:hypothetical protein
MMRSRTFLCAMLTRKGQDCTNIVNSPNERTFPSLRGKNPVKLLSPNLKIPVKYPEHVKD